MGRRQQHLVRRFAQNRQGRFHNPHAQRFPRGGVRGRGQPRFGQHHQALGAAARIGIAEHRHATAPHAIDRTHHIFKLMRINIAAGADDDVLDAAGQMHFAVGQVGAVTAVEPVAVHQLSRACGVAVVTAGGRGPPELQPALDAFTALPATAVDDAHLMPWHDHSAGNELQGRRVIGAGGQGTAAGAEGGAPHPVDARPAHKRRAQQAHRAFGQAIHRCQRRRVEPVGRKAFAEAAQGLGHHRLGAVGGDAP